jgi:hypothetical protein
VQGRSVTKAVRASEGCWGRWQAAADLKGETRNAWIRRSLGEAAELDLRLADELVERRAERDRLQASIRGDAA